MSSQTLQTAIQEIREIIRKHDVACEVTITSRDRTQYQLELVPSWRSVTTQAAVAATSTRAPVKVSPVETKIIGEQIRSALLAGEGVSSIASRLGKTVSSVYYHKSKLKA